MGLESFLLIFVGDLFALYRVDGCEGRVGGGRLLYILFPLLITYAKRHRRRRMSDRSVVRRTIQGKRILGKRVIPVSATLFQCTCHVHMRNSGTIVLSLRGTSCCCRMFACPSFRCRSSFKGHKRNPNRSVCTTGVHFTKRSAI